MSEWLCRIGLHKWQNILHAPAMWIEGWGMAYPIIGRRCKRCALKEYTETREAPETGASQ